MSALRQRSGPPDGRTRLLGIVGRPLDHSLSPRLQSAVLRMLERNLIYLPLPVSVERLPELLSLAGEIGLLGLNVTTPYKEAVAGLVRAADRETERTGMVNTIRFTPDGPQGCGTDGVGILDWMAAQRLDGLERGVLGFGPTARSLIHRALAIGRPVRWIVTRRPAVVRETVRSWGDAEVEVCGWDGLSAILRPRGRTLWVSTLPPAAFPLPDEFWDRIGRRALLLDMNYGDGRTPAVAEARGRGLPAADGRGPLLHQAARSLSLWLGEEVPVKLFQAALGEAPSALRPRR